jgi:predicted TIM-barrel fold metal-dependent hydrolase
MPFLDPVRMQEAEYFMERPLLYLVVGGVLARHPRLRVVFAEMGAKWAIDNVRVWDLRIAASGSDHLAERPSFYLERQVFFGISRPPRRELEARYDAGIPKLMWGSDHPHGNSAWGRMNEWLRAVLGDTGVSAAEATPILGETAAAFYRLDTDALRAIADRIGPTPAEILRPLDTSELDADPVLAAMLVRTAH